MPSPGAFLTDLYQLTMAAAYWQEGMHDRLATFHLFFRTAPFGGRFAISCGLPQVAELVQDFRFEEEEIAYLGTLTGGDGKVLFRPDFLAYLARLELTCDIDAVPEGTVLFPSEPSIRVSGPILQCQLLETPLLTLLNFPTLIATKAARICQAAGNGNVLEFGLRRAQGRDGGLTASRAAYIGGCAATSNVAAGRLYDIPVRGTHAHSWVTCFDDEIDAFAAWARAMPNNSIFLVDTYDSIQGVKNALEAGRWLRDHGYEMAGIRLDSGDLLELGIEARRLLDEAGFPQAAIVASNDLDEYRIEALREAGSPIGVWGVGTRLATAWEEPALGGVFKLSALHTGAGWDPRIKLSETRSKVNLPGRLQIRRYSDGHRFLADVLYDLESEPDGAGGSLCQDDGTEEQIPAGAEGQDLLLPFLRQGRLVSDLASAKEARGRCLEQLNRMPEGIRRLTNPAPYPVRLEKSLYDLRERLISEAEISVLAQRGEACS